MQNRWILGLGLLVVIIAAPAGAAGVAGMALPAGGNMNVIYLTQENAGSLRLSPVQIVIANVTTDASGDRINVGYASVTGTGTSGTFSFSSARSEGEYGVNTVTVTTDTSLPVNNLSFSTASGTSAFYKQTVAPGAKETWIDLEWPDSCAALDLMVYAPDATLGPFNDTADGRRDDRIFLNIAGKGNVTPGDWYYRIRNTGNNATPYTLNTYTS
jgi:hypothetical protein